MARNILFPSAAALLQNEDNSESRSTGFSNILIDASSSFVSFPASETEAKCNEVSEADTCSAAMAMDSPVEVVACITETTTSIGGIECDSPVQKKRRRQRVESKNEEESSESSDTSLAFSDLNMLLLMTLHFLMSEKCSPSHGLLIL